MEAEFKKRGSTKAAQTSGIRTKILQQKTDDFSSFMLNFIND